MEWVVTAVLLIALAANLCWNRGGCRRFAWQFAKLWTPRRWRDRVLLTLIQRGWDR
jgi:hypothetical protein